jgi:hypothetical protein
MRNGRTLSESRDFEGMAFAGGPFLAEEGTPAVHRFDWATGQRTATLTTPAVFASRRANFGFESLTADGDGGFFTANEEALTVDGPVSSPSVGTVVRLLRYRQSGPDFVAAEQYAYRCDPMHGSVISGARSGVSDLLVLSVAGYESGTLLALERSFAFNLQGFFENRVYQVETWNATDVSAIPGLIGATYTPSEKSLLWRGRLNANMEGLALGRHLAHGRRSVIGIVDDGDPISVNSVVGFVLRYSTCLSDFNEDGGVDGGDLEAFFSAWEAGQPDADVNGDGGVDGADVETFFCYWEHSGCL